VTDYILEMKNNKATGYGEIPVEFWKMFCIRRDGLETLTNMFNKINSGNEFPLDWKITIKYPYYMGKGKREKPGNYRRISLSSVCDRIYSGILAGRLRDWLIYHKALLLFQARFIKGKGTTGNVFVFNTTIKKYFRFKRACLYWCFVDFEKLLIHFIWYILRRKAISDNMVKCINEVHDGIKFCMERGEDDVADFIEQRRGIQQICILSPYLFNMFIDDITDNISKDNPHAPVMERLHFQDCYLQMAYPSLPSHLMVYRKQQTKLLSTVENGT
jgi:hypothetical protein